MPRQSLILNQFLGVNNVRDSRDITDQELASSTNLMFDKQGALRTAGAFTTMPTTGLSGNTSYMGAGNGLFYIESDRALSAGGTHTVPDYSGNFGQFYNAAGPIAPQLRYEQDSSFTANFTIGDKIKITGSSVSGTNVIRTVIAKGTYGFSHIQSYLGVSSPWGSTGSSSTEITIKRIPRDGELIWLKPKSNSTTTADNREIKIWNSYENAWALSGIRPTEQNDEIVGEFLPRYYYADLALRVADTNLSNGSRIIWYGFIERNHFGDNPHLGWFVKNNTLDAPTGGAKSVNFAGVAGVINWDILTPVNPDSDWIEGIYDLAHTYIYDDSQESKLFEFAGSSATTYFTVAAGEAVSFKAKCNALFDERHSGSRLYCRLKDSDDDWILAAEVHFSKGIKSSLSSEFKPGFTSSTVNLYNSATAISLRHNLDTYESLNGFPSDLEAISLGKIGESWKVSCVANRRVFIANLKIQEGDDAKTYGDRIMYSEIGKYDTFPSYNFIDVVKGDAEVYVALVEYGDRLLAFKNNTLFVLNIANPSPTSWFLEKTFKHKGVKHAEAVFRTEDGVIWVNEAGCWVYNGEQILNLIDNKLDPIHSHSGSAEHGQSWVDFYTTGSIVGYSPKYKQIFILSNCGGSSAKTVYCFDIRTKSWSLLTDSSDFFSTPEYSNFILDGNGDLVIMTDGGAIKKYSPQAAGKQAGVIELITKYIDFNEPNNMKKIYKVAITYRSSVTQANILTCRYINKNGGMQNSDFSSNLFDSITLAVHSNWGVAVFKPTSALQCQSVQFKINAPSAGTIEINEIMIYYRLKKTIVKSGV